MGQVFLGENRLLSPGGIQEPASLLNGQSFQDGLQVAGCPFHRVIVPGFGFG
jgi:hypothetical protein